MTASREQAEVRIAGREGGGKVWAVEIRYSPDETWDTLPRRFLIRADAEEFAEKERAELAAESGDAVAMAEPHVPHDDISVPRELLQALAPEKGIGDDSEMGVCVFCDGGWDLRSHMPSCPWVQARQLLRGGDVSEVESTAQLLAERDRAEILVRGLAWAIRTARDELGPSEDGAFQILSSALEHIPNFYLMADVDKREILRDRRDGTK